MKLRWKITIALALAAIMAVAVVHRWMSNPRRVLEAYRQQLRLRGEKLTIEELIPIPPDGPNGASALLTATFQLNARLSNYSAPIRLIGPAHALVASKEAIWPVEEVTNVWPELIRDVAANEAGLVGQTYALTNQNLFYSVNYQQGFAALLPHLAPLKRSMVALSAATMVELHRGSKEKAWEHVQALSRLARLYPDEPIIISELIRAAIIQIALGATWEALQYDGWREDQLAALQAEWEATGQLRNLESAFAMEAAMAGMTMEQARHSHALLNSFSGVMMGGMSTASQGGFAEMIDVAGEGLQQGISGMFKHLFDRYPKYWLWTARTSFDEERVNLEEWQAGIAAVRQAQRERAFAPALRKLDADLAAIPAKFTTTNDFLLVTDGAGTIAKTLLKIADAEVARRLLVTAIALKRFRTRHEKYPETLSELVPDFLSEMPIDWFDGKPLRYRRNADGAFLLYSVGEDGKDDGGDPAPSQPPSELFTSAPYGVWWRGRDAVWPSPASAVEVRQYFDSVAQKRAQLPPKRVPPPVPVQPNAGSTTKTN